MFISHPILDIRPQKAHDRRRMPKTPLPRTLCEPISVLETHRVVSLMMIFAAVRPCWWALWTRPWWQLLLLWSWVMIFATVTNLCSSDRSSNSAKGRAQQGPAQRYVATMKAAKLWVLSDIAFFRASVPWNPIIHILYLKHNLFVFCSGSRSKDIILYLHWSGSFNIFIPFVLLLCIPLCTPLPSLLAKSQQPLQYHDYHFIIIRLSWGGDDQTRPHPGCLSGYKLKLYEQPTSNRTLEKRKRDKYAKEYKNKEVKELEKHKMMVKLRWEYDGRWCRKGCPGTEGLASISHKSRKQSNEGDQSG